MDKYQALNAFWNSFGVPAYDENTVPAETEMPRITYEVGIDTLGRPVAVNVSLWDYSTSWQTVSELTQDISDGIGFGGKLVHFDGGAVWIKRASPFAQRISDDNDMIRRVVLNISLEFLKEN